jgi:hypothetical protein
MMILLVTLIDQSTPHPMVHKQYQPEGKNSVSAGLKLFPEAMTTFPVITSLCRQV